MSLQTVIETPEFIKRAKECMSGEMKNDFISFIAKYPNIGDIIADTGGARKIRWQSHLHKGKRSGARVIYYYHDEQMPIFLFTAYKKKSKRKFNHIGKICFKKHNFADYR